MTLSETTVPVAPIHQLAEVTDGELKRYAELIYRRTGIRVPPQKKTLLSNRVRRRLRETGIQGFGEYYEHLKRLRQHDPEWDAFLQEITTHETFLFRDHGQWEWFRKGYLLQCAAEARAGSRQRSLRIWSANFSRVSMAAMSLFLAIPPPVFEGDSSAGWGIWVFTAGLLGAIPAQPGWLHALDGPPRFPRLSIPGRRLRYSSA